MTYSVNLKPRADRDLDKLPILVVRRIWRKLLSLEIQPRPPGSVKWGKKRMRIVFELVIIG